MRMTFGPDDESTFHVTRDDLVRRFEAWMREVQLADPEGSIASDAELALNWRWGYGDGDLAAWTGDDLEELFLDWCPRKLSAPADLVATMPINVVTFVRFLEESDLLDRSASDQLSHLEARAVQLVPAFTEAMDDPAGFGLGKSILGALGLLDPDSDFDPSQPGAMEEVMERFNSLPDEVRFAITDQAMGAMGVSPMESIVLSPVRLPDENTTRASALAAPFLARFATLAEHCGDKGLKLTAKGNLTLADARLLVEALDTGDELESEWGGTTHTVRSAADLPQLDRWFLWAKDSGVVRVQHGRLHATKSWPSLVAKDPRAAHAKALGALLDEPGILAARDDRRRYSFSNLPDFIDAGVGYLLGELLDARGVVDFDDLADYLCRVTADSGARRSWEDDGVISGYLDELLTWLEHAGVVTQTGAEHVAGDYGIVRRAGGLVSLTPIGTVVAVDEARAVGIVVPIVGDLAKRPAEDLAAAIVELDDAVDIAAEVEAWLTHRDGPDRTGPAEALLDALVDVAREGEPAAILTGFTALHAHAADITVAAARGLLDSEVASIAQMWLIDIGVLDVDDADPELLAQGGIEFMGAILDSGDPDDLVASISDGHTVDEQIELVEGLWRIDHPRTAEVLDAIGRHHPHSRVAKAARKAAMQARSRRANRR